MNSTEFLDIGQHCSDDSCRQLDFLPFSCPSCGLPFCASHWRPDGGHACASYDPALADNRIPSCPLCATPISFPPGTDPNAPMDAHLSSRCPVLHPQLAPPSTSTSSSSSSAPRTKPKAPNTCRAPRCRTKMLVPIRCDACRASFCPAHRFPSDHACAGAPAGSGSGSGSAQAQAAGASVKRALGGLLGSRSAGSSSASTSGTKKAPPPARASTSSSSSRPTPPTAAAAVPPPRPAPPPPSRAGLAALRRAQHAARASEKAKGAPVGTSANPLVLDSSDDDDEDGEVQVVEPGAGKGKGAAAAAGRKVSGAAGARAGGAAAGSGAGGAGAGAGAGSAATKALARTGLRGAPSKRALQEQESARKALEVRARKGLLTEDEKVRYATMQALQASAQGKAKGKGGDEACVVS